MAAENLEIDGPSRAEMVVPMEGTSLAVQFGLRGLKVGPGRVMIDFGQEGSPVGSVDLATEVVIDLEGDRTRHSLASAAGATDLSLDLGRHAAPPDLVLKVFEHRLTGHPGRLQFVLSSTHPRSRTCRFSTATWARWTSKSEVAAWVDAQLHAVGSLAERPTTRSWMWIGC